MRTSYSKVSFAIRTVSDAILFLGLEISLISWFLQEINHPKAKISTKKYTFITPIFEVVKVKKSTEKTMLFNKIVM